MRVRWLVFAGLLVLLVSIVLWLTWQSVTNGSRSDPWSYSTLLAKADQGQVVRVEIRGAEAVATARDGSRHEVRLPDSGSEYLNQQLLKDDADIIFEGSSGIGYLGSMLIPNVVLLALVGGLLASILLVARVSWRPPS